jgi:diguanylate cyclase (GGDEF)-like protein
MAMRVHPGRFALSLRRVVAAHRLTALVIAVSAVAAVIIGAATAAAITHPPRVGIVLAVVVAATLLSDATCIDLRVGNHIESYTWAEVSVVLGLALLPPEQLILSSVCLAVAYIATRRSLTKIVFNTASYAVGVALAVAITRVIATPSWQHIAPSMVGLALGAAAFSWWNGLSVDAAIAFSQGLPFRHVYAKGKRLRSAVCLGNIVLAFGILALVHANPALLLVLPPCLGLAYLGYRAYLRTIQERAIWRHLEMTTTDINRLDETEIAEVALDRVTSLLECDEVELHIAAADEHGSERRYARTANGKTVRLVPARRAGDTAPAPTDGAARADGTAIVVPLVAGEARIGELRVFFHAPVKLNERERHVLVSYAYTLATSLEHARLYREMQRQAEASEIAARHDPLTGLANRVLLHERVCALLDDASGSETFALMLIDLDHFKDVNDGLGHIAGDNVLRALATRLRLATRPCDVVSRLGGDEFAILLTDATPVEAVAERLLTVLTQPIEVDNVQVAVGASIGIACYPHDGGTFEELLKRADFAMYDAKTSRGTYRRYRRGHHGSIVDRLSLAADLRAALDDHQLELYFQPQLDLATNEPVGAEALVRWRHPARGLLSPVDFVGLFESSTLLREFTCRVLDLALAECARWQAGGRPLRIAVNLSARDLDDERLPDDVAGALARHGVPAERLVLEITESAILGDLDFVEAQMARLASLGVLLSIDDFGTGHSNLTFLQRVTVHELKIDRSFVAGVDENEHDAAITRATVGLGHSLGLRTVAEGVEDVRVLEHLLGVGCDSAQGYLWSPPVPGAEIRRYLGIEELIVLSDTPSDAADQDSVIVL